MPTFIYVLKIIIASNFSLIEVIKTNWIKPGNKIWTIILSFKICHYPYFISVLKLIILPSYIDNLECDYVKSSLIHYHVLSTSASSSVVTSCLVAIMLSFDTLTFCFCWKNKKDNRIFKCKPSDVFDPLVSMNYENFTK